MKVAHGVLCKLLVGVCDLLRHRLHALGPSAASEQEVGCGFLRLACRSLNVEVLSMKHRTPQQNNSS